MNYGISILFRAIPLLMGAVCLGFGLYVLGGGTDAGHFVAGHVLIALTAICIALFTTAAMIIRQITGTFAPAWRYILPAIGYGVAVATMAWGLWIRATGTAADSFVAGHVVFGVGLIAACVSTVATASSAFTLISQNSAGRHEDGVPAGAYAKPAAAVLIGVPAVAALVAGVWAVVLLTGAAQPDHYVAGHVMLGLAAICSSLISLVATVVRQVRNQFDETERWYWTLWVAVMGSATVIWGLFVLLGSDRPERIAPGCVLLGLGMICFSIISKVFLLASVWRRRFPLANRVPLIPVFTCLLCLFFAAFLAEAAITDASFFIPARVLTGLGAVCFTLFSIVSILEAGTSQKS
ncbi:MULTISPECIES: DUF2776 domain-containing protein [unclassified Microbacterium]|uniref:DUF2776 domain-containing protein n=1 Tax=unclassified Microbacterium TaxID=2609290 RepID=UPI00214C3A56|nr:MULTISPECIES: DUF2776 domain-containing protein [unclassified Microbacterium]MCR2786038.1 DUF2776 domain-containing protein [Microbacterium sp. zg.B96]MDL5352961.1 DUF2776 domain-containing protein [Microbacterium sp. zg-YB36]WIM16931.1 DUF2776 domain-containing protein [Microbacterium sp. zg-B96]